MRGIFKKFWKVLWRGVIFVLLLVVVVLAAGPIGSFIGKLPISLKGEVAGVQVAYLNLQEIIHNVILQSGQTQAYATAFTEVVLKKSWPLCWCSTSRISHNDCLCDYLPTISISDSEEIKRN